jgi:hypothetical protein
LREQFKGIQAAFSDNSARQLEIAKRLDSQFNIMQGDQRTVTQLIMETRQRQMEMEPQAVIDRALLTNLKGGAATVPTAADLDVASQGGGIVMPVASNGQPQSYDVGGEPTANPEAAMQLNRPSKRVASTEARGRSASVASTVAYSQPPERSRAAQQTREQSLPRSARASLPLRQRDWKQGRYVQMASGLYRSRQEEQRAVMEDVAAALKSREVLRNMASRGRPVSESLAEPARSKTRSRSAAPPVDSPLQPLPVNPVVPQIKNDIQVRVGRGRRPKVSAQQIRETASAALSTKPARARSAAVTPAAWAVA